MPENTQRQAEPAKEKVVEYQPTGGRFHFHAREISARDWRRAGVEDQKTVVWNKGNDFQVPVSEFNEAALKLLEDDDELNVREV